MRVYVTGDTHGDFKRVAAFCDFVESSKEDVIVILGDAGINYEGKPRDSRRKTWLARFPITFLCIHGNHEIRPERISSYEETIRFDGIVYREQGFPNLLFAKCGEVYNLYGNHCIAIGGANSIDKYFRIPGVNWWPDEQPTEEIRKRVEARLDKENWCVDIVFSHTCPYNYMPIEVLSPDIDQNLVDNRTEMWLQSIEEKLSYAEWYCGHFHTDKLVQKIRFVQDEIHELGKGVAI